MADKVDLLYACKLPPAKAVEYFRSKGYAITWNWQEMWQDAHAQAFTVAKVTRMDILQDIRNAIDEAVSAGVTFEKFKKQLEPKLREKGWWGKRLIAGPDGVEKTVQLGSPYRLRTIYDTNTQTAYQAGRYKAQVDNRQARPYGEYVSVMDSRTSLRCRELNGKIFALGDPLWDGLYPPNHWGCRARVRTRSRQEISGENLTVESSEGLLGTAQVPIGKTGETAMVMTYRDPASGNMISPDAGWSYNPGKAKWKPDLQKYDADIRNLF